MDAERFTEAALQLVASAQAVARTRQNQQVTPLHLAAALLADPAGLPSRVVERAGGDAGAARGAVDAALEKLPKVSGEAAQYLSNDLSRTFDTANTLAGEWQDAFVAADTLLVALRRTAGQQLGSLPDETALTEAALAIRGGRNVDSRSAESTFEALEKYGIDLTERARKGELDPVIGRDDEIRRTVQILLRRTKNNPDRKSVV